MSALDIVGRIGPTDLACAFPPRNHLFGAMTTVADLSHHGLSRANRLFVPNKTAAVELIVATNYLRANSTGGGHRFLRRYSTLKRHDDAHRR